MTVNSTTNRVSYAGNGTANPFAVAFPFQMQADLLVIETQVSNGAQTTKALTTNYTITGTTDASGFYPNGGNVVPVVAIAVGLTWTIIRAPALTQSTQHVDNDPIPAASIDNPLDRGVMISQRLNDKINLALVAPDGVQPAPVNMNIPAAWFNGGLALTYDNVNKVPTVQDPFYVAAAASAAAAAASFTMPNYLTGLTLSTAGSSATFGVAAGGAMDSTNVAWMLLASAYTKTTAAWALGTGNGALDTGTIAINSWYNVFLIKRLDTGVTDILLSLSVTAPTLPANYTRFRRLGAIKTDATASPNCKWVLFHQVGDFFQWDVASADISTTTLGTAPVLFSLNVPAGTGIQVYAKIRGYFQTVGNNANLLLTSGLESSVAANSPAGNITALQDNVTAGSYVNFETELFTGTSAQIRGISSAANSTLIAATTGWFDYRGK